MIIYGVALLAGCFMVGNLIKQQFLDSRDWPFGSTLSIMLTLAVLLLAAIAGWLGKGGKRDAL